MFRRTLLIAIVAIAAMKAPALAMEAMPRTGELLASGRVVKVDIGASRITIEHKPIWRFYMEAGTRIFKVRDVSMLLGLTPGDWIRFIVERTDGGFVVTWIENSNGW